MLNKPTVENVTEVPIERKRRTDGWFGWVTAILDFIDNRDIDKHAVAVVVMTGQWRITEWAFKFADDSSRPGLEVAAIIAAVAGTYSLMTSVAVTFYFKTRV